MVYEITLKSLDGGGVCTINTTEPNHTFKIGEFCNIEVNGVERGKYEVVGVHVSVSDDTNKLDKVLHIMGVKDEGSEDEKGHSSHTTSFSAVWNHQRGCDDGDE